MANTSSRTRTPDGPRVCILYGFCEGPHLGEPFEKLLAEAGFRIIRDPAEADIIAAHSGGCLLASKDMRAKIVMIGLTYWPGKSIIRALVEKNWNDFRLHRGDRNIRMWLHKFSWNLIYFWNMPNNFRMWWAIQRGNFWQAKNVTLVRNQEDSFCTPDIAKLPFAYQPKFIELPGQHDDIWLHPERYVTIIKTI